MDLTTGNITDIKIEDEMRSSYLDYAMSVIIARALPDVRDGLKPVQRRILFAMRELGMTHNTPHKKSARVVGEVLGKYHPHGDSSVYDAMVRMAQDFSMRHTLVDGQGNFGSVDNDPAAAMRYTEVRLSAIANYMLLDIDKDTVNFMPNFDDSLKEPTVLPSRLPNLLVNGAAGIAVGMATSIPPHNLGEICSAINYLIDNPEASVNDLMEIVKGPDFPTGAIIQGVEGIRSAYATGHGRVVVKARAYIDETPNGRYQIIVTELPYQVNKAALIERIAGLVKEKKITGISDLRDESDRQGMRIVIELKREGQPQAVLNNLFKRTPMQSSFFVNMLALVDGQPQVLSLKEALQHFIQFRQEVITRRTEYELKGAKDRAHILEGLKTALDFIDEVIATIRAAKSAEIARGDLMAKFELSQIQAQAILDMQLRRLANLERQRILDEYAEVLKLIGTFEDLLANPAKILGIVKKETNEIKTKEANPRKSELNEQEALAFSEADLIPHQAMVVTLSDRGFIKRVPRESFTTQHRGGKGIIGMVTREADTVRFLLHADTHDNLLFFTTRGRVFKIKCYEVPLDVSRVSKGLSIINLIPLQDGERVTTLLNVPEFLPDWFMLFATQKGEIKKVDINSFSSIRTSGLLAMDLDQDDCLVSVRAGTDENDVVFVTKRGQSIRFPVEDIRTSLRASGGVRAIKLIDDDQVIGMDVVDPEAYLLVVTERGFGKITPLKRYPVQKRAGSGVKTFHLTGKTGQVTATAQVVGTNQVMLISATGIVTRTPVKDEDPRKGITVQGRSTQGVKLMDIKPDDCLVAITVFD
jgi:DNA gyrase subunit A